MLFKEYPCKCYSSGPNYWGESDFECLYETEETSGNNEDCTECVTSWSEYGGRRSPKNWKIKWPWIVCFILWGPPRIRFRDCRSCKHRLKTSFCNLGSFMIKEFKWNCEGYQYKRPNLFWFCWKLFCWYIYDCIETRKRIKEQKKQYKGYKRWKKNTITY